MEMLSEHQCQGWLEGYLLDRPAWLLFVLRSLHPHHGFDVQSACQVVEDLQSHSLAASDRFAELSCCLPMSGGRITMDSVTRTPGSSTTSSTRRPPWSGSICRRRQHAVVGHRSLPPQPELRQRGVAGKQPAPQWLTMDQPRSSIAPPASASGSGPATTKGKRARRGHGLLRRRADARNAGRRRVAPPHLPELKMRVVNVVNLMKLQPPSEHPHGLSDKEFDALFTTDKPIMFAFHGYPWLIHRLTYRRTNHPKPARARLQGRRDDHDAVRHGGDQRARPIPPGGGRDRSTAAARRHGQPTPSRRSARSCLSTSSTSQCTATICLRCVIGNGAETGDPTG
jgi:xylulose-5-phosphate/fructose-6-phosphate phosphoketolase